MVNRVIIVSFTTALAAALFALAVPSTAIGDLAAVGALKVNGSVQTDASAGGAAVSPAGTSCPDILRFETNRLRSEERIDFCQAYAGRPLLVVNTASRDGQRAALELQQVSRDCRGRCDSL